MVKMYQVVYIFINVFILKTHIVSQCNILGHSKIKVALYVVDSWAAGDYNGPLSPVHFSMFKKRKYRKKER